eukprot:m.113389 g.113389  ORF g.113389 m.113389 type:complete len:77 (-) comp15356_c6_seq2:396-626(-)
MPELKGRKPKEQTASSHHQQSKKIIYQSSLAPFSSVLVTGLHYSFGQPGCLLANNFHMTFTTDPTSCICLPIKPRN